MKEYVNKYAIKGGFVRHFSAINNVLSGNNTRALIPFPTPYRRGRRAQMAILSVVTRAPSENVNWRVKLNGISVTKEYRPVMAYNTEKGAYHKFLYDVTEFVNTENALSRNWVNLSVRHEGGTPLVLDYAMLLMSYEDEDFESEVRLWSGLSVLLKSPISLSYDSSKSESNLVVVSLPLDGSALLSVRAGQLDVDLRFSGKTEFEEHELRVPPGTREVELSAKGSEKGVLLSEVIRVEWSGREPSIHIDINSVERTDSALKIKFTTHNIGEGTPDTVVYTVISRGRVLASLRESEAMSPGRSVTREITCCNITGEGKPVLRVAWNKLFRTHFSDYPLP